MRFLIIFLGVILFAKSGLIIDLNKTDEKPKNIFSLLPPLKKKEKPKKKSIKKIIIPPYAKLSLDLLSYNKYELSFLIKKYDKKLPFRDKLDALVKLKRISEAKKLAFNNLQDSDDYLTYKQVRDFYMEYANRFKTQNSFVKTSFSYIKNQNGSKIYLFRGYYLYLENKNYISDKYSNVNTFKIGVKKLLNKGFDYLEVGEKNSRLLFLLKKDYIFKNFDLTLYFGKKMADESDYLLFNGIKIFLKEHFLYNINNRNLIESSVSFNRYSNKKILGNGVILNLKYINKLRISYPDFAYYLFVNYNKFTKNYYLPQSSYEGGAGFFAGLDQKEIYHHTIRPFVDAYINYNNRFSTSVSFLAGVSARAFRKDNLSLGVKYSKALNGADYWEYQLNYIFWF